MQRVELGGQQNYPLQIACRKLLGVDTRPVTPNKKRATVTGVYYMKLLKGGQSAEMFSCWITAQNWMKYIQDTKFQVQIHVALVFKHYLFSPDFKIRGFL